MATFTFQNPAAETFNGTGDADVFVGSNNFFGAGDRAFGSGGIDEFLYFADPSITVDAVAKGVPPGFAAGVTKTFAAFQLNSVEVVTVVNDSGAVLIFDMSSSSGVTDLVSANSSDGVIFDQVTNLANIRLADQTFVTSADVAVGFQSSVLTGDTSVNLVLQNTAADTVRIGGSGATLGAVGNTGVENLALTVLGNTNSSIQLLDTQLTKLTILDDAASTGGVTIANALAGTVRVVDNQSDGGATVNASAATGAVAFTGVGGADNFTGGAFNDTFNLGEGNNTAVTGGGINTVNTGSGADTVFAQGTVDTVNTGAGNDSIVDSTTSRLVLTAGEGSDSYIALNAGEFNARANTMVTQFDSLNMGAGFDVLFVAPGVVDAQFAQVTSAEGIAFSTAGAASTLGGGATGLAQAAGINSIFIASGSAGNDIVDASTFTTGLSVTSSGSNTAADAATLATQAGRIARFGAIDSTGGGNDQVTTGSAVDYFLFRGDNALTQDDQLVAGGQTNAGGAVVGDTLVLEGDTVLAGGGAINGFSGFEVVLLESAVGSANRTQAPSNTFGNQYNLTITNANAPSTGSLFINGSNLKGAVADQNANESVTLNAAAVTAFALDITTGGGTDNIILGGAGALAARVVTQGGNDNVTESAGNTADDIIDVGAGNDTVNLRGGNNTVFAESGNNLVNTSGAGNDTIFTGTGSDLIQFFGTTLTGADTLADAGGLDGIFVSQAGFADSQFAGVNAAGLANSRYEVLFAGGANTYTLGANAARAGFTTIVGDNDAQVFNLNNASFAKGMRVDLSAGGNDIVNLGNVAAIAAPSLGAPTPAGLFDFIESPINGFTFAPPAAGYPAPDYTANANLVIAGTGDQIVNGGTGSDVLRVNGAELTAADTFAGGAGYDAIQIDNTAGGVTAVVNLTTVTNVELFQTLAGGDRIPAPTVDADTSSVTFQGGNVGTLTQLKLDNSAMNDSADTMRYILNVADADYAFTIFGAQAGTTFVDKQNGGTNNNINFQGGAGVDILKISGGDLGSTTIFNGGAGTQDAIIQRGGQITDDDYFQVTNVEILTADLGFGVLNAVLGMAASMSGLTTIQGTTGNDVVVFDPAFTANVSITLSGGDDNFNATGAAATLTFNENLTNITAADILIGGANGADTFNINAVGGGAANLSNVDGIEVYNITANGGDAVTLTLGNAGPSTVNGLQTFNFLNATPGTITVTVSGGGENASTSITTGGGNDQITLGSGNDIINTGGGNDSIYGGMGNDTIDAGSGNDQVTGGMGNDTIDGGTGDDSLRGQAGNDTILGGTGNDIIYGGDGADVLNGGAGNDQYLYLTATSSQSTFGARDTVTVGTGDTFVFDGANPVNYVGTASNFADAQSSTVAGDNILQAVFQSDQNILWIDINDDGTLNANDLQILVQLEAGVTLDGTFFVNTPGAVAAFEGAFIGPV